MDISTIKPSTIAVDLIHPGTGDEIGLTLQCVSRDDPSVKKIIRRQTDRRIKKQQGGRLKLTAEQIEEENQEIYAAAVVGWTWGKDASWGGKKLDHNPENVKLVLSQPWITKQVVEAIGEDAEFFSGAD